MDREWHRSRERLVVPRFGNREGRRVVPRQRRLRAGRPGHRRDAGLRRRDGLARRLSVGPVRDGGRRRPGVLRLPDLERLHVRARVVVPAGEGHRRRARVHVVRVADVEVVRREERRLAVAEPGVRRLRRAVVHVVLRRKDRPHEPFDVLRRHRHVPGTRHRLVARRRDLEVDGPVGAGVRVRHGVEPRSVGTLRILHRRPRRRRRDRDADAVARPAERARRPVRHIGDRRGGRRQARARAQRAHGLFDFPSESHHFSIPLFWFTKDLT